MSEQPSSPPILTEPPPSEPEQDEFEVFIHDRLRRTQRQVKGVDLAAALITLSVGALVYLLIVALADHWLVSGGFGFTSRLLLLLGLLAGGGYFAFVRIVPLIVHRINPLYAAQAIEQSRPSFKNSLVNFLFLRRQRRQWERNELAKKIYRGLEERTAAELADTAVETTVDRSEIIRLGYVLVVVVALFALYLVFSPKSLLLSVGRVMLPWADIQAPTRVVLRDVTPGDCTAFQGETLTVTADVTGLSADDHVSLYFTTADGQSTNQAVPMTSPDGDYSYRCDLPPGSLGLQQDLDYYLAAGDAKTRRFHVRVEIPLTILVDKVHYDYPAYTGIADRDSTSGDIRAIEGTKITVTATANQPIQRASVEMNCDPRHAIPLKADNQTATGTFTLRMTGKDRTEPERTPYQLRFVDAQNRQNPAPVRHEVEVYADRPPNVRLVDPPDDEVKLPINGVLPLKISAEDPDFALRRVGLRAERGRLSLPIDPLLNSRRPGPPHQGSFEGTYRFEPGKLGLKEGDKVTYWAEAEDNREPASNHSEIQRRAIVIVAPQQGESKQSKQSNTEKKPSPQNQENQQPEEGADQPKQGADHSTQPSQPQEQPDEQPSPNQEQKAQEQKDQEQKDQQKTDQQESQQQNQQQQQSQSQSSSQQNEDSGAGQQGRDGQQSQNNQKPQDQNQNQEGQGQGQSSAGKEQSQPDQQRQQEQPGQQPGAEQQAAERKPVDGQTDPGKAFEEILEHRREEEQKQDNQQQQGATKQQQQQPDSQPKPGAEQQPAGQQPGNQSQPENQQPQNQQPKQPGQQQPKQPGEEQPKQPGQQQPQQPDEKQPDEKQPDGQQPPGGQQQSGPKQDGPQGGQAEAADQQKPDGEGSPGGQQGSNSQSAAPPNQPPQQTPGDVKNPGEKHGAEPNDASLSKDQEQPGNPESSTGMPSKEKPDGSGSSAKQNPQAKPEPQPAQPDQGPEAGQPSPPQPEQSSSGAGKPSQHKEATPTPLKPQQRREMPPAGDQPPEKPSDIQPDSPSISPRPSDTQGDNSGDRSGGGQRGGGQQSRQPGAGSPGSQMEANDGGEPSKTEGPGETGSNAGSQAQSSEAAGQPGGEAGQGTSGASKQPSGGKQSNTATGTGQSTTPEVKSAQPSDAKKGDGGGQQPVGGLSSGSNNPEGGAPGQQNGPSGDGSKGPLGADAANLEFASEQTDLALDHLKHELTKNNPDLLDRLGWSKQYAREWIRQWERLKQDAHRTDERGEAARKELKGALESLGLRPHGTELKGGRSNADDLQRMHESRRIDPPSQWAEQFQAYTKGLNRAERTATPPKGTSQ